MAANSRAVSRGASSARATLSLAKDMSCSENAGKSTFAVGVGGVELSRDSGVLEAGVGETPGEVPPPSGEAVGEGEAPPSFFIPGRASKSACSASREATRSSPSEPAVCAAMRAAPDASSCACWAGVNCGPGSSRGLTWMPSASTKPSTIAPKARRRHARPKLVITRAGPCLPVFTDSIFS